MTTEIYLDSNATNVVLAQALAAANQAMEDCFGNPSSTHIAGLRAKALLETVRQRAARVLGAGDGRLMFNSGATEGIHTAVLSALVALRERRAAGQPIGRWLLCGATEHKAVPESLAHWNRLLGLDLEILELPVDGDGRHDLGRLHALASDAALVCTMAANNETGVISDLAGIERILAATGSSAYWLVDGVQALGKLPLNLAATRIDYAPFSGHKLYAPKGMGLLYVRAGAPFTPLMVGGGQESGWRSGTENMAGIAALGAVLAALEDGHTFRGTEALTGFRDQLADSLRSALPDLCFNTPLDKALPTTLNFSVPGLASQELLNLFDAAGVRVSAGSACSSGQGTASHVLQAMQLPTWRSASAVRLSIGPLADQTSIDAACNAIARCGAALQRSGRVPSAMRAAPHDGVMAWDTGSDCGWLLADALSRTCVVIDPPAALVQRLAAHLHGQDLTVRAILGTSGDADAVAARQALRLALAGRVQTDAGADAAADTLGWVDLGERVLFGQGLAASAMRLGQQVLVRVDVRVAQPAGRAAYLLGSAQQGLMPACAVRFAFTGDMPPAALPADLVDADTLLCRAHRLGDLPATTLRAEQLASRPDRDRQPLDAAALAGFLLQHPDATLVDVREAHEHAAAGGLAMGGRSAISVPMARLTAHAARWLRADRAPLIFICRSGQRSQQAAAWMRRLGRERTWHVAGGLAQTAAAPAVRALAA